ncbi:MAG: hypothetical protein ACM30G_23270, partial [Micromonosporaceae bacterium]
MPDPLATRWLRLPRGRALLRWTAVALLLALAAGVLLAGGSKPPPCPPEAAAPASPGPIPATPATPQPDGAESTAAVPALDVPKDTVGVLVRLADPAAATVLRPGSRVDLLPAPAGAALRDVLVLAVVSGGLFDQP